MFLLFLIKQNPEISQTHLRCRYRVIKTLGRGSFGKVKLATNIETKEMVAMKIIDMNKVQQKNMCPQVKKEISIMKKLKHPRVVQVKEVLACSTKIFIVMEYIPRGELKKVLASKGDKFILCFVLACVLQHIYSIDP